MAASDADRSTDALREALERVPEELRPPEPGSPAEVLLRAAREHFAVRGFTGARTRAIAKEAGVNLGLLHYYFGSKEQLYRRVLAGEILAVFRQMLAGMEKAGDRAAMARELPPTIVGSFRHDPVRLSLVRHELADGAPHLPAVTEMLGAAGPAGFRARMLALMEQGQSDGDLVAVPPETLMLFLMANAYGLLLLEPIIRVVFGHDLADEPFWEEMMATQRRLLGRALRPEGEGGDRS